MNWLVFFLMAFVSSSLLNFILLLKSKKYSKNFFRLGGVAIILSFIIALIFSKIVVTNQILAILIGSSSILIFGVWDDIKNLNWKIQILFQIFLALILIWFGFEIDLISFGGKELMRFDFWNLEILNQTFSLFSAFFIIFWLTSIINAVNWLDGSDGLLSSAGILSLLAVFFISLRPEVNQPALAIISVIGLGSLVGFFIFNFPPAKIEAGTSGSYFVGFLLASLAIIAGTKIATTMVILILPITDFIWVIGERLRDRQSIFKKDDKKRHLHYKLLSLGLKPWHILLSYGIFLSLALLASLFVVNQTQKITLLSLEFIMILLFMIKLSSSGKQSFNINLRIMLKKTKKILINPIWPVVLIIGILMVVSFWQKNQRENFFKPNSKIEIGQNNLKVQIVQTPEESHKGLSGLKKMPDEEGMLFIYEKLSPSPHVMREMEFDLDFVFLKNGEVVFIQEKVNKNSKEIISSPIFCNQVLELNAGEVEKMGIKVGDKMEILDNF